MDEKHRQYCIKLGNPYMDRPKYNKFIEEASEPWIPVMNNEQDNYIKNNKKFTY